MKIDPKILIQQLEANIRKLKYDYEMYFLGHEKLEPIRGREDIERQIRNLQNAVMGRTADRFKFQTVMGTWMSLKSQWDRILLQIERGTYTRDRFKAKLHGVDIPKPPKPGSPPEKKTEGEKSAPGSKKADPINQLYNSYINAKKSANEDTRGITLDSFRTNIQKQATQIKQTHGDKRVKFKVVVENGKAKLKASLSD